MASQLLMSRDLRVALDHGQFYLYTATPDPDLTVEVMEEALGVGVAQRGPVAVLMSPHQNNFEMALRVEVWSAEPPIDVDEWQEAFELHLDVSDFGLYYDSTVPDLKDLRVPPGSYSALVTGRDFVAHGWPGSATPGDKWRVRLFPSDGPSAPRRIREWVEPRVVTPPAAFRDAGVAAVRRLNRALNDRPPLSGRRGTARAERTLPGTRRSVYRYFESPHGWLTQGGGGDESGYMISGCGTDDDHPFADANRIVPIGGFIRCTRIEAKPPAYVEVTWTWEVPESTTKDSFGWDIATSWMPVIPPTPQTTLRFELTNGPVEPDWPTVHVTVLHIQVPEEFVDDLCAYWTWRLEDADYSLDLSGQRTKKARLQ